jgi:ribosomal-protein-alanine N-acetyltransferase
LGVENNKYDTILANADPDNKASMRVLEKAGFQKGVLVKNRYSRPYLENKVMSDLQAFSLARPEIEEKS